MTMYSERSLQIALDEGAIEGNSLTVKFPHSAVLYLRSTRKTPNEMTIRMVSPDGNELSYKIPVMKIQDYDIEALFRKGLLFLLPFHLFCYEKDFDNCERDMEKLKSLTAKYQTITERLEILQNIGVIDEFTRHAIIDMTKEVTRHLAEKHEKVKEGVESTMGGKILDYEAKDIRNEGRREGMETSTLASIRSLMETLHLTMQQAMDALKIPVSEQENTPHNDEMCLHNIIAQTARNPSGGFLLPVAWFQRIVNPRSIIMTKKMLCQFNETHKNLQRA